MKLLNTEITISEATWSILQALFTVFVPLFVGLILYRHKEKRDAIIEFCTIRVKVLRWAIVKYQRTLEMAMAINEQGFSDSWVKSCAIDLDGNHFNELLMEIYNSEIRLHHVQPKFYKIIKEVKIKFGLAYSYLELLDDSIESHKNPELHGKIEIVVENQELEAMLRLQSLNKKLVEFLAIKPASRKLESSIEYERKDVLKYSYQRFEIFESAIKVLSNPN